MKKPIKLDKVGIRVTFNSISAHNWGRLVPYFQFSSEQQGLRGNDTMMWHSTICLAYNDFVTSSEYKGLHPKVMTLYANAGKTIEFCSSELKNPEHILHELHKVFESPVLDAYIEALDRKPEAGISDAISAGITFTSIPKGKKVLEEKQQAQEQEQSVIATTECSS